MTYELVVVGGGPAGLAAACAAYESGLRSILIAERDSELGGILNQCIHNGFGLHRFREELTGPEYAGRYIKMLRDTNVEVCLDTTVLEITADRRVSMVSKAEGYRCLRAKSVVLAMGCRERTRGAIAIPGTRPAGVLTAGAAQRYVNMEGYLVGRSVVILGSGDIGLIMARRMTLEGAKVLACVEVMPYSGGLNRNIVQCLHDYGIPLYLSHTVTEIKGRERLQGVTVAKVDESRNPIAGTEVEFECDTLLLSVGLIPENELSKQAGITIDKRTGGAVVYENMETSAAGVFACGNVVHVHDLVDFVSAESERAGRGAALFVLGEAACEKTILSVENGAGITYTVPQQIRPAQVEKALDLFFRVNRIYGDSLVRVTSRGRQIARFSREHLAPGEMEHLLLPRKLLELAADTLTISIEEAVK